MKERGIAVFCPKCGAENAPEAVCCTACGANLPEEATTLPQQPDTCRKTECSPSLAVNALKTACTSPLLLAAIIAYSAAAVLNLLFSHGLVNVIVNLAGKTGADISAVTTAVSENRGFAILLNLVPLIPILLIAAGLWMTYAAAHRKNDGMSTGGITLIRVIYILLEIALIVGAFMLVITLIFALAIRYAVVTLIVLLIVYAFILPFCFMIVKMLKEAKITAQTGVTSGYAPVYVGVIAILAALFSLYCAFSFFRTQAWTSGAASLCSCVSSFCFGVFVFRYRKAMRSVKTDVQKR